MIKLHSDNNDLIPTSSFPYVKYPFEKFNPVQSRVMDFYHSPDNVLVASSTGSGKTIAAELVLCHEIFTTSKKGLYLAPHRALANEKFEDWKSPDWVFRDKKVSVATGDFRLTANRIAEIESSDLIVMTAEALNARARNPNGQTSRFLKNIGIVVVDESHLLTVPGRGDHLESAIIKLTQISPNVRLVLLSATLPNVEDVGKWVAKLTGRPTNIVISSWRPVQLNTHYPTYRHVNHSYEQNEENKVTRAMQLVDSYPADKFLIFAHAKRTGEMMLKRLRARNIQCEFHSADLTKERRAQIEDLFKTDPKFRVLVATSTVAWGCYAFGTEISMADGTTIPIESVKPGDLVTAFDCNNLVAGLVTRIGFSAGIKIRVELAGGNFAEVSERHQFYGIVGNKKGYFSIGRFGKGDSIAAIHNGKIQYQEIVSMQMTDRGTFVKVEVAEHNSIVGNGIISHNCNLPARRVIILGVHRGRNEVETYDVAQMCGRAGRPKYDKEGDAYILLPDVNQLKQKERISTPMKITSQLQSSGPLAFHLVSEIHHRSIKAYNEVEDWYAKTLAFYQKGMAGIVHCHEALTRLESSNCLKMDGDEVDVTPIGAVASMFYYNPFDVSAIHKNLRLVFGEGTQNNELYIAFALSCIPSYYTDNPTVAEQDELDSWYSNGCRDIHARFSNKPSANGEARAAYVMHRLITGSEYAIGGSLAAMARTMKGDFDRLIEMIMTLDDMAGKWGGKQIWERLLALVVHGVEPHLIDIAKLTGIGPVKADRLYRAGLTTLEMIGNNPDMVSIALKCKPDTTKKIVEEAKLLQMTT